MVKSRKSFKKSSKTTRAIATKALTLAKSASKAMENKIHDVNAAGTNCTTTPTVYNLSAISEGSGLSNRTGIEILPKSIEFSYWATLASPGTSNTIRIMIVRWADAGSPLASQVLQLTTATNNLMSPKNREYSNRVKVIYDKVHHLDAEAKNHVNGKKFIKLNYGKSKFVVGSTTSINGNYSLILMGNDNTNQAQINYFSRFRFKE